MPLRIGNNTKQRTNSNSNFNNTNNQNSQRDTTEVKGIVYEEDEPDSLLIQKVFIFHYQPLAVKIMAIDHPTLSPTGAQWADHLDGLNEDYYLSRGIVGQQHLSLYPRFGETLEYRYMPDLFAGYSKRPTNVPFYQTLMPYSVLGYHSSLNKDYQVRLTHTQNITERWNVALNADLMRVEGVFTNSRVKNTFITATTNYYSHDSRYQIQAGFINQNHTLGENGGLADDGVFGTMSNFAGMPVNLYGVGSFTNERTAFVHQSFNTVRPFAWQRPRMALAVDSTITDTVWQQQGDSMIAQYCYSYRTYDTIVGYDTIQPNTPHILNTGVVAMDVEYNRFFRKFDDSLGFRQVEGRLYWTNDAYMDHRWQSPFKVKLGVRTSYSQGLYFDSLLYRTTISPFVAVDVQWQHNSLALYAEQATNNAEFRYSASLRLPLDSAQHHVANLSVVLQRERHYMLYNQIYYQLYSHTLDSRDKFTIEKVKANYCYKDVVDWEVSVTSFNNYVVLKESHIPSFFNEELLLQSRLTLRLVAGWFHCDMQQLVQYSNGPVNVPRFASKNSLYADTKLFHGALRAQIGVDIRYHTTFDCNVYDPSLGVFCYTYQPTKVGNYLWGDLFINLQVKRATIYAKAGHVNALWEQQPTYFLLPHYPGQKFGLFYGVTWQLFE